jgi:branched-chain amino acid transport system permease protein
MSLQQSGFVVMMVLIGGGLISFWGPLIGAAFFILARDLLGAYTETWLFWYGLLFMAIVLFKPEGLAGMGRDLVAKLRRKDDPPEHASGVLPPGGARLGTARRRPGAP